MKKILVFILFFISLSSFGQKFIAEYNTVIDFDGKERIEKEHSGKWVVIDSTIQQIYGLNDTIQYKISKFQGRNVYHINGFGETVKFTFNVSGDVTRINLDRQGEYIIYRKK